MSSPLRSLGARATVTVEVEGVTYSGEVVLAVKGEKMPARRVAALQVAESREAPEKALCACCEHRDRFAPYKCYADPRFDWAWMKNPDGKCEDFTPSRYTRFLRFFRLGRAPLLRS